MDINVSCKICNSTGEVIKWYTEEGGVVVVVNPCTDCIENAK